MVNTSGLSDVSRGPVKAPSISVKDAMDLIFKHRSRLSISEQWIIIWLIHQTGMKFGLKVSAKEAGKSAGVSDRSFQRYVVKLKSRGFITIQGRKPPMRNIYWVNIQNLEVL